MDQFATKSLQGTFDIFNIYIVGTVGGANAWRGSLRNSEEQGQKKRSPIMLIQKLGAHDLQTWPTLMFSTNKLAV